MSKVEVTPSSFLKVKMLGKGDVGKVYLVREKKTSKLFAMKGIDYCVLHKFLPYANPDAVPTSSAFEERNDRTQKDQARIDGAGDSRDGEPPIHCHALPFVPVGRLSLLLHGVLQRRGVLQGLTDAARQVPTRRWRAFLRVRSCCGPGISALDGIHLPRPETRE